MIAPRFSAAAAVLLGLALVPTVIHDYIGLSIDDGRVTTAVDFQLAGLTGNATGRKSSWVTQKFASDDWMERWYTGENERIQLLVVRSYDLKRLYHHPELAIVQTDDFASRGVVRLADNRNVPIHVLESSRTSGQGLAMYALHYDKEFVDDAVRFQLRTAASLLVGGRRQMTLFFVHDAEVPPEAPLDSLPATRLLFASIDGFVNQPATDTSAALGGRVCTDSHGC